MSKLHCLQIRLRNKDCMQCLPNKSDLLELAHFAFGQVAE